VIDKRPVIPFFSAKLACRPKTALRHFLGAFAIQDAASFVSDSNYAYPKPWTPEGQQFLSRGAQTYQMAFLLIGEKSLTRLGIRYIEQNSKTQPKQKSDSGNPNEIVTEVISTSGGYGLVIFDQLVLVFVLSLRFVSPRREAKIN